MKKIKTLKIDEKEYSDWMYSYYFEYYRYGFLAYILIHCLLLYQDYLIVPEQIWYCALLRLGVGFPILFAAVFLSYVKSYKNYFLVVNIISMVILPISLIILMFTINISNFENMLYYYAGLIIQIVLIGLFIYKWRIVALINILIPILYYITSISTNSTSYFSVQYFSPLFFITLTGLISTVISYIYQKVHIKMFLADKEILIQKEKAEESDRLKSAFLANMSHEIRTPMNGILGFSELLKSPNLSGEKRHKYIEIIEKSGKRMLNIINDIVDISKIEAGLMKMDIKESNVNEQIEYIYTFFKPEVEAKGMQLFFKNILPAKEATIKTDREKLFAILTNLVKNAIKYTKEGSIEFGYVLKMRGESVDQSQNDELEFYVKDTGIGIPKDRQEAIFERFIQADISDEMAMQGAGLGLSITKAYIEMLGGKIWVESEEGMGSIFYFTLPYNPEQKEKNSTKDVAVTGSSENHVKNLKILIAEDDENSEMLISINVSEFSNEILKARTGRESIEACRNNPDLDLILMDIQMPDLNGYEATRQIRQFNKDVVIIAQTAYGLSGDREKALNAGCNDYISKPIKKIELQALIQKYFKL